MHNKHCFPARSRVCGCTGVTILVVCFSAKCCIQSADHRDEEQGIAGNHGGPQLRVVVVVVSFGIKSAPPSFRKRRGWGNLLYLRANALIQTRSSSSSMTTFISSTERASQRSLARDCQGTILLTRLRQFQHIARQVERPFGALLVPVLFRSSQVILRQHREHPLSRLFVAEQADKMAEVTTDADERRDSTTESTKPHDTAPDSELKDGSSESAVRDATDASDAIEHPTTDPSETLAPAAAIPDTAFDPSDRHAPDSPTLSLITALRSQISLLTDQSSDLNAKLIAQLDRTADLEDEIERAKASAGDQSKLIEELEAEKARWEESMNTGLLVERGTVRDEMQRLVEGLVEEERRRGSAEEGRQRVEREVDDLSATLFEQVRPCQPSKETSSLTISHSRPCRRPTRWSPPSDFPAPKPKRG